MIKNLVKDSVVYGGADFFSKALAFVTFPIIAAVLTPLAFGTLELLMTTIALLGLFMNCGVNNAVQRFYWDKDTLELERPVVVTSGFLVLLVLGFFCLIIGFAIIPYLMPYIEKNNLPITGVALVSSLALLLLSQWLGYLLDVTRLHFAPWRFFSLSLTSRVLGLALGVVAVVWLGWGVDGLLAVQASAAFIVLPFAIWTVRKDITFRIDFEWIKSLTQYGYPYIFAGMAYWIFGSIDRWMLASMSSVEEVGIYSVAFRFASVVLLFSTAFGQAWSPYAIKIRTDQPLLYRQTYARVLLLLLFCMLVSGGGVALFSGEIIGLIMPLNYGGSALPLALLCFGIILQSTQQVTAIGISIEKKTFLFSRIAWVSAGVNFILNYLLIPRYGGIGAAWATSLSYLVLTSYYLFYTQRLHPLPIQWRKLGLLLILGTCILVFSVMKVSLTISWSLVLAKIVIALICASVAWRVLKIKGFRGLVIMPFRH